MKRPRVIPTLLIRDGDLVKTKRFAKPDYLGDPLNAIRIFNEKCVDELCILDISASRDGHEPDFSFLKIMASESFMPLSYGGGIKNIDQIKKLFRSGFEKVVINSAAANDISLIRIASQYFGSQSIVASIDYKKSLFKHYCYVKGGSRKIDVSPLEYAVMLTDAGAGEILLYSIERDGMRSGYDTEMIHDVSSAVNVPVIACGGAGSVHDIKEALDAGASAAAAGSLFVYYGDKQAVLINYPNEEEFIKNGIYI